MVALNLFKFFGILLILYLCLDIRRMLRSWRRPAPSGATLASSGRRAYGSLEQRRLTERMAEMLCAERQRTVYRQRGSGRGSVISLADGGFLWGDLTVTGAVEVMVVAVP